MRHHESSSCTWTINKLFNWIAFQLQGCLVELQFAAIAGVLGRITLCGSWPWSMIDGISWSNYGIWWSHWWPGAPPAGAPSMGFDGVICSTRNGYICSIFLMKWSGALAKVATYGQYGWLGHGGRNLWSICLEYIWSNAAQSNGMDRIGCSIG